MDSQYWNSQYQYSQNGNQNQYMQCQGSMSQPSMSAAREAAMEREISLPCVTEQGKDADFTNLDFTALRCMLENKPMSAEPTEPDIIVPQVR